MEPNEAQTEASDRVGADYVESLAGATTASLEEFNHLLARLSTEDITLTAGSEEVAVLVGLAEGAATYAMIASYAITETKALSDRLDAASR